MIAVVFPGQGSQKPGMGRDLVENNAEAQDVFRRVSEASSVDIKALCFESDEETLRQTQNAQLALFTCGVAAFRALGDVHVGAIAGHSVGEYAAFVASGVFTIEDGARLVQTRGRLMARSGQTQPGTMAAVLGLDRETLDAVCHEAEGIVVVANDNCPGQLVISGEIEAVKRVGELAQARGAKRVLPLNVSGAFHSPLMSEPAREMGLALAATPLGSLTVPVYSNVTSRPIEDASQVPGLLERQLASPVRWTESVQNMIADGVDTFIELGVGEVLCGLIRRIDKGPRTLSVHDGTSLAAALETL
jgi:[acyl-carrier-protein] S-malonyltransferase